MKLGLRLQILLLLGGLLVLAFSPLYFAVATYMSYALREVGEATAHSIGHTVARQLAEARSRGAAEMWTELIEAHLGRDGVEALAAYTPTGTPVLKVGPSDVTRQLPPVLLTKDELDLPIRIGGGRAIAVAASHPDGAVVAVVRSDQHAARRIPLIRLVGLYMGLIALSLLLLAYFALTHLIIRPLDGIARAAQRVAAGARRLEAPERGPQELVELGRSLETMTARLISEEAALRRKIDEVEDATRRLREAQDRLVRSERLASVGRLAAGLAHEVGNPISAILGIQDLLIAGGLSEAEQRDFLERMRRETERINRILRDLLQFARPADRRANSEDAAAAEPGNVEAAIHDTVTLVSPQESVRKVDLAVDVYPDLPPVSLPSEQLVQVILNLLLNAADACGEGGHVTVRARPAEAGVRISVEDDGPGVPPEVSDRLFEPFVTTKEVGKGTGLGLAVCRGLVEAVGGSITLDTEHAPGARFVVDLPRVEADPGEGSRA